MTVETASSTLKGTVERIVFRNEATDWSVLRIRVPGMRDPQVIVGLTRAQPGQEVVASGEWKNDASYGRQFVARWITATVPAGAAGILAWLGSGDIPGIGPETARRLVDAFGDDTLRVLDEEPDRILSVHGIGQDRQGRILAAWRDQKAVAGIMTFLHAQKLSPALCRRIHRQYGERSIDVIQENPYRLALEVSGIGFRTADGIGARLGIPRESAQRLRAGLLHLLQEAAQREGHVGIPRGDLVAKAEEALAVAPERIEDVLGRELAESRLMVEREGIVFLARLAAIEEFIAARLKELSGRKPVFTIDPAQAIPVAEREARMTLTERQREAVAMALSHRLFVLTGGPGCGKTSTLRVLLSVLERHGVSVALAAPTGKAAQRAAEASGREASTIHRLFGLGLGRKPQTAREDVILIDEASMIDVLLMRDILKGLSARSSLILVGDADQLPSVGPGQVLADLIGSGHIPVVTLDRVFRQADGSWIAHNAHRIRQGLFPQGGRDFLLLTEKTSARISEAVAAQEPSRVAEAIADEVCRLAVEELPRRHGFCPRGDIQVLSPMNRGACGVQALNERLQTIINPEPAASVIRFGVRFGVGDKVIQTRNNYDLEVMNGDTGRILDVDPEDQKVRVSFAGRLVAIPFDDLDDLRLAYCITVHKSQGSQAPCVIIPAVTQHWLLLQRNLLYTAVTRAERLAVVIGPSKAIAKAVRTMAAARRVSRLRGLLES